MELPRFARNDDDKKISIPKIPLTPFKKRERGKQIRNLTKELL